MHYKVASDCSGWNRLLLPLAFTVAYEATTWLCWVPLSRVVMITKNGVPTSALGPFWAGTIFAFSAIRILAALALFLFLLVLIPRVRRFDALLLGMLTGVSTSTFDRLLFDWFSIRLGSFVPLFGVPLLCGGITILLGQRVTGFVRR